jgi:hypothetical protein
MKTPFSMKLCVVVAMGALAACSGDDAGEESVDNLEGGVSCSPQMWVFPVGGPHNIGYDGSSCGSGTCATSCPDQNANSDYGGNDGSFHHGIDVFAWYRAPLVAVVSGTIQAVGVVSKTSGIRVRLRDACGWEYYYGHLDEAVVSKGQYVEAGQLVGYMGNTGTSGVHLHFNVSPDGGYSNDINPINLLVATSPTACGGGGVGDNGCTAQKTSDCAAYGCACADGSCSGGACDGNGCSAQKTGDCAAYGCACVDGECSGGACDGSGCTWKRENDCGYYGCGCTDMQCSGGACDGTGCTWKRENDCGYYGCGCQDMECSGGACPGSGCSWKAEQSCGAYGCGCSLMECSGGFCP